MPGVSPKRSRYSVAAAMLSASWSRAPSAPLLEVAADDRNLVDRGDRRDAQAAGGAITHAGVGQRQVVDRGGKTSETCLAISSSVAVMPM
jgi:hypothetical protein